MAGNDDEETTMKIDRDVLEWLAKLKVHERESYNDVLKKIRDGKIKSW
ncbi:MAG: hypothetical protein Sv326_1330 (plasmid) [Candidatus Fermentimicrarchaeum limneticum]|uniref:Uncharacterized protein n=1 Tax=Fermentimicrarchaeum limneticum TaxID=2795018 RepID=A0A7D5XD69_FERL1|nr:MAG: hypothetical protein Sv326_1330 [Candidatus Fermentimicrarchaeum limneticum]